MYNVYDRSHNLIASFSTLEQARKYKEIMGRPDWYIPNRRSTLKQRAAVEWCQNVFEQFNDPRPFKGNIQLFEDCSNYLHAYLESAKSAMKIAMDDAMSGYDYDKYGF